MVYPDNCRVQLIHPCPSHFAMCCNIPNRASCTRTQALGASLHSDSGRFAYQNPQRCFCSLQSRVYSRNPLRYHACPIIAARTPGVELDSLSALEARSIIPNFSHSRFFSFAFDLLFVISPHYSVHSTASARVRDIHTPFHHGATCLNARSRERFRNRRLSC